MKPRLSKELICLLSLWLMATLCLLGKSNSLQKYWTQRHHVSLPLATPFAAIDGQAQDAVDNSLQKGPLAFLSRQDPNEFALPESPAPAVAKVREPAAASAPLAIATPGPLASAEASSTAGVTTTPPASAIASNPADGAVASTAIAATASAASVDADTPAVASKNASVATSNNVVTANTASAAGNTAMNSANNAVTPVATGSVASSGATTPGNSPANPAPHASATAATLASGSGSAPSTSVPALNPQSVATSPAGNSEAPAGVAVPRYAVAEKLALSKGDKILFAGDSLMQGLVPHITRGLRRDGFSHYLDASKQSTGFSYPATFDWPGKIKTAIVRDGVNTVVIFIGANDAWSLASGGKLYSFGSPPWKAEYTRRVREVVQFAHQHKARVMWLELPPMHYDNLTKGRQVLNDIYRQVALEESAMFIQTARVVSDDQEKFGLFKTLADGKMAQTRLDDGVHFTKLGQTLISKAVLQHFTVQEAQQ